MIIVEESTDPWIYYSPSNFSFVIAAITEIFYDLGGVFIIHCFPIFAYP